LSPFFQTAKGILNPFVIKEKEKVMGAKKRVNASGEKPQIVPTFVNGRTRWLGSTDAANWISAKRGIRCTTQTIINAIMRKDKVRPLTHADIVRQEYPEIFGIAK